MVNQLNKFSPKITELTKPLRELLKVDNAWIWDTAQENAFQQIKHELASSGTLSHYDQLAFFVQRKICLFDRA
jgi:MFS superfamily sulfate permease-like transporter